MNISGSPARCGTETGVHDEVARRIETAGRVLITSALLHASRPSRAIASFMVPTATTFSWKIQRASLSTRRRHASCSEIRRTGLAMEESRKRARPAVATQQAPSYLLGQPSSSMLDSWLHEDYRPGGAGPVVLKRIPAGLRVLIPMMLDGAAVLRLCDKVRGATGASVAALVADEDAARAFFDENRLEFTSAVLRYTPPWYMDASKLEHLTRPVRVYTATERSLTVYACDIMDPAFERHSGSLNGAFHRVLDQGALAHAPPDRRAQLLRKIRGYARVPAQLLICGSVHDPGEVASSLPGTAYSLQLAEMQALCGSNSAVHRALQVNRSQAPLGLTSQQAVVYWIWLADADADGDAGLSKLRPPSCPCCK